MSPIPLSQVVYALAIGGSETLARRLALGLTRRHYTCSIYAVHNDGPLANLLRADGIPCRAFSRKGKWDLGPLVNLIQQFRANGTKVVHTHHIGQLLYGGLAGRLAGCRVIHTEHDYYTLRRARTQQLLRVLTRLADRVTAVAEPVRSFLEDTVGLPSSKLITIQNGVEVDRYEAAIPHDRKKWDLKNSEVIIGCVARLSPEKGHTVLLRAFQKVINRHSQARLVIIGEGGFRPALEQLIASLRLSSRVRLVGAVPHQALSPWYNAADLFCLVSAREGWPNVILEALACGTPVVATAVGGIPEVLRSEKVGLLTERSMEKIAESITRALRRPWKEDEIVQYARQYQWEHAASAIVSLFRGVLASHGSLSSTAPFTRERRVG